MKKILIAVLVLIGGSAMAQDDHIGTGLASVAAIAGETKTIEDSVAAEAPAKALKGKAPS